MNNSNKIGVLLAQLGTPTAPTAKALRPYLRQFLSDPRVVDVHPIKWYPILYGIVLTFRPKRSAALYKNIWTEAGSPLMVHSRAQEKALGKKLGSNYEVILGMQYGDPSISNVFKIFESKGIDRILVFPMYPQFSCATTGSVYDAVNRAAMGRRCPWFFSRKRTMPTLRFVPPYFKHPAYINALAQRFRESEAELTWRPDHYLITFHGIPNRYVKEGDPYRKQCEETADLLAKKLNLDNNNRTLSFQSRFGKEPWLEPYTEEILEEFGKRDIKKLLTCCPGFTSDCLETIDEIGREGLEQFERGGGDDFHLSPCLNEHPDWIQAMETIVREETGGWV